MLSTGPSDLKNTLVTYDPADSNKMLPSLNTIMSPNVKERQSFRESYERVCLKKRCGGNPETRRSK